MEKRRIAVIGAGNVAWHLAPALSETHIVTQVMSRSRANAEALASRISGCEAITSLSQLQDNDIYLISAKDDAIGEIVNAVGENSLLLCIFIESVCLILSANVLIDYV